MPRPRRAILRSLQSKGFELDQKFRDLDVLRFRHRGLVGGVFTNISRGTSYRDYSDGLLARMCKQLYLTRAQLNDLIDCPLDEAGYIVALTNRGKIRALPAKGK